ncbi:acyl carrier protein [Micromonospora sp. WMMD1128]|uniref:acyl carrier protein n=1 Tax=Micromonospora sp. WMMD1128 TaxID=3015150 RepID=UPI00248B11E7|nr:acyl carrier protein [Micromonospora sp. WMMD1128]WBB72466.1 acyl carrier protein [Micromonospora sp. WMMD1128]
MSMHALGQQTVAQQVLAEISGWPINTITASTRLSELGLDSLDRLTLAVLLEGRTGRPLSDDELISVRTLDDLERLLRPAERSA